MIGSYDLAQRMLYSFIEHEHGWMIGMYVI